ncbi:MAG: MucB/RseB C-terminal domain-containing protein [Gammaproteobacteria bacterium]|nr:MucB/RseB C-terminal domain-containing protein [Gammaproteobacteria bacterium]
MTSKTTPGTIGRSGRPGELLPENAVFFEGGEGPKIYRRLLLIMILAGMGTMAKAEMDPAGWLVHADEAVERANFSGMMSLLQSGETRRTMKIEQGFDGRSTYQRLVSVSGREECEILRRNDGSAVVFPDRRLVIHGHQDSKSPMPKIQMDIEQVDQHYELEVQGKEEIAGRDCQLVMAASKDEYRYGCEFCVDTASGLPLRARLVTPSGEKIEQFSFTSLDVRDSMQQFTPDSFWLETDTQGFEMIALPHSSEPAPHTWRFENLPPGFEERFAITRRLPLSPDPIYHIVLADALSRVSVFVTHPPEGMPDKSWRFSRKALNGYVTVRDGHQVTVIGGVPAETVRMIGDSIRWED